MSFEASEEKNYTYPHEMSLSMVTWTVLIKIVSTAGNRSLPSNTPAFGPPLRWGSRYVGTGTIRLLGRISPKQPIVKRGARSFVGNQQKLRYKRSMRCRPCLATGGQLTICSTAEWGGYHCLPADYAMFEKILAEAQARRTENLAETFLHDEHHPNYMAVLSDCTWGGDHLGRCRRDMVVCPRSRLLAAW